MSASRYANDSTTPKRTRSQRDQNELFRAILSLKSPDEAREFFQDLCTPMELESMADRWKVVQLLERQVAYREIYELTGVSTATITRVARALLYGEGGYLKILNRIQKENSK